MSQRDGLGSGTNGTTDVPGVGQRGGTQGFNSGGTEVARSGVCMSCATLVREGLVASSNHTPLSAGKERGEREWQCVCNTSHTANHALF